ncbi:MAG: Holliday junction branch migration protein RuvA [Dethiobacteria bacterium]
MISYLRGIVRTSSSEAAILETGGIGYEVFIPARASVYLRPGEEIVLFTHLIVKEDHFALYGFINEEERDLFVQLLGVSGVGPKVALSLLSSLEVRQLTEAIGTGDLKTLMSVPGIGRKSAQRLVFELKEKLPEHYLTASKGRQVDSKVFNEAYEALRSLGYTQSEIVSALNNIQQKSMDSLDAANLTKLALRYLASR